MIPKRVRKYGYGVITAAIPLLTGYGVIAESMAPQWGALAAALLGTGTAAWYTRDGKSQSDNDTTQ